MLVSMVFVLSDDVAGSALTVHGRPSRGRSPDPLPVDLILNGLRTYGELSRTPTGLPFRATRHESRVTKRLLENQNLSSGA